jgi:hypothetical protein
MGKYTCSNKFRITPDGLSQVLRGKHGRKYLSQIQAKISA